jgi:hypothetical protein
VLLVTLCAAGILLLGAAPGAAAPGSVVAVGRDAEVVGEAERVVVVGGDAILHRHARVDGDVIVLFGSLRREPGARIGGAQYVVGRGVVSWIPGPGWVEAIVVVLLILAYRALVWSVVWTLAASVVRTATYERWSVGWERRPGIALAIGLVAVAVVVPALALLAATGLGLPIALLGLAALLVAAGVGLALLREGPLWPHRPGRLLYAAYLVVPPALEIGLLLTGAAGVGAGLRALTRRAKGGPPPQTAAEEPTESRMR